jgi:hypothetical protein
MVDFQDPNVIARDYCAYVLRPSSAAWKAHWASLVIVVLTKLFHTMGGLYMYADPVAHSWLSDNTLHYSILHLAGSS